MRIGIFFGGPSREREISFAGGRTVYDNLNKSLFEPVPMFVDSFRNLILLDWQYIYKGSIRDFYPPLDFVPDSPEKFQVYVESLSKMNEEQLEEMISSVGRIILPHELSSYMDFAFLALHGVFGEDGQIQGILEAHGLPYSGSGILPSAIGMNKAFQKRVQMRSGLAVPQFVSVTRDDWQNKDRNEILHNAQTQLGDRLVIKPANQGSSIGVSIVPAEATAFIKAVDKAFFRLTIEAYEWKTKSKDDKVSFIRTFSDIRESLGLPVIVDNHTIYQPDELLAYLDAHFAASNDSLLLQAFDNESEVLIEEFIEGKEFSCIVIRTEEGKAVALPPTEIVKGKEVFDYRSKYLAGLSRKITPIQIADEQIEGIRRDCESLFEFFGFHVYARIDGFIKADGTIYLNDPNTTSGMLPSSFFFHQAAEIGLNPSQFLTYIIRLSLQERLTGSQFNPRTQSLMEQLDEDTERHISVESGRNIFEKLASSDKYEPFPVFLTGNDEHFELYQIPVNILLKDNADDIKDKVLHFKRHRIIDEIRQQCSSLTAKYADANVVFEPMPINFAQLAEKADAVFIALHGRPGEDGALQKTLEEYNLPYNGSGVGSSSTTINKFDTLQLLKNHGFQVADQSLYYKSDYIADPQVLVKRILQEYGFPFIAKPVDDGCSSAVKKIKSPTELEAFLELLFRNDEDLRAEPASVLKLKPKEEFSRKDVVLVENFIDRQGAKYFLEVTGGMLTHKDGDEAISYEVFEPSETLAGEEVLSLEEKFLAGEGQNITPARFGRSKEEYNIISARVKEDLKRAATLLNVEGYCRIDAFVRVSSEMEVETIIIEVNSLPGMTPATVIFHQAAINGYKPYDFIDNILEYSFKRNRVGQS
jgi:UDP-N-acetylmuramate--alanine ligase